MLAPPVVTLTPGLYPLRERFSAADMLWGAALGWTTSFEPMPEEPVIMAYLARVQSRPAFRMIRAAEAARN